MLSQSCSAAFFGRHAASRINSLVVLPQELLQTILGGYRGGHATVAHVKALQLAKAYHRRTYGTSATSESYLNQVKPPFRILFAGADRFSCTSLELLAKQDKSKSGTYERTWTFCLIGIELKIQHWHLRLDF